ncbi:type III-A CRISPR-associated RAMP protein Csm3 [archaeon]|nr:type III-A CRISPR-associated RAMP protein Csm3 [Acholeplasmataceae bacterium]MCK9293259.1 type III-A CRISPR-associated RAMP protein Csm3 [archaeon]MCK9439458.1 type III-A CRISPR-associated RAMP protein Csm3 [Patescibacteria group bacterium]
MKKIIIKGILEVKTGLHIGGDSTFSSIGSIDSPVIRNASTGKPIIPGSSLKGKIRSLLAKNEQGEFVDFKEEKPELKRLFGSDECRARLIFSDINVIKEYNVYTEVKYENSIKRKTGEATPRQIERVVPNVEFDFNLTYNVIEENDLEKDFNMITRGLKLLESDYLGGGGTRGNGRIVFKNLKATSENDYDLTKINNLLDDVVLFGEKLYS